MINNTESKYSVLIFEDDFTLATEWKDVLTEIGFDVEHSWDVKDALNLCEQIKFDIIICDIFIKDNYGQLKAHAGINLILRMRRQPDGPLSWGRDVPILVVTGASIALGPVVHDNIKNMKTSMFLRKPFTTSQLVEKIQEIISELESKENDHA